MAQVHFGAQLQQLTGGTALLQVPACNSYRELVALLEQRFPGIGPVLATKVAVAIDGEIIPEPLLEPIPAAAEVHFLPRLGGG